MNEPLQQKTKPSAPLRRKLKSSHVEGCAASRSLMTSRSVEDLSPALPSTTVTQTLQQTLAKSSDSSRKITSGHKRLKKKVQDKRQEKTPSPNALAQASRLFESPRSITPPDRSLSDDGLLVGNHSLGEKSAPRTASNLLLVNLYSSSHDPTNSAKAKPLWMKAETLIRDTNATPTRQRQAPPAESLLNSKGRLMLHQIKLERSSSQDCSGFGMQDAVQRRRRKHFEKCEKAATEIQRMARGWLARSHSNIPRRNLNRRKGHKQGKTGKVEKNSKKEKKSKTVKTVETGHNCASPTRRDAPPPESNLTPMQSAMRKSSRRLGASQRDVTSSSTGASGRKLLSSSFVRGSQISLMSRSMDARTLSCSSKSLLPEAEDTELEQNLCNMFRSNIASVTARARRRSIHG
eukprot:scaffold16502_cov177-Amphora_coffeaeformis.AAC.2